jgi:glutamate dehydrogenase (NAD(P)+)
VRSSSTSVATCSVPGARPNSVSVELARRGEWAVVAPGANIPYAAGALEIFHGRGILAIPDFVSNSGGVHLYESVADNSDPAEALRMIEELVRAAVERIVVRAEEHETTPTAAALAESRAYLREETGAEPVVLDELFRG